MRFPVYLSCCHYIHNCLRSENCPSVTFFDPCLECVNHRRTIYTEEKAKVVAAVWGMYLNGALTI